MAVHHLALASRDTRATHAFYTEAMNFGLVKVEIAATPSGGWAKHFFYDQGDGALIAFWELHDETMPADLSTGISTGLGLPVWVNHIAFAARDRADLDLRRERLVAHGIEVLEIDHGWCVSIYAEDPNGILVEFCLSTRALTQADRDEAQRLLLDPAPEVSKTSPPMRVYRAA